MEIKALDKIRNSIKNLLGISGSLQAFEDNFKNLVFDFIAQKTKMADFHEMIRQDVLQEPFNKVFQAQGHHFLFLVPVVQVRK